MIDKKSVLLAAVALLFTLPGRAEVPPKAQEIIEALKPTPTGQTRNIKKMPAIAASSSASSPVVTAASAPDSEAASAPAEKQASATASDPRPTPPAAITQTRKVFSFSLAIPFEANAARLGKDAETSLQQLRDALQSTELQGYRFRIEGHTDAKGNPASNFKLTEARASEVRRYLINQGIDSHRLEASGMGSTVPADLFNPKSPENRRIRIVLID